MPLFRGPLAGFARRRKRSAANRILRLAGQHPIVVGGVFAGLKYSSREARCSAIIPKLLGTYEHEIAPVLSRLLLSKYKCCLDVGSAEGYYAIGIARMLPDCIVYAIDPDADALRLCEANAKLNECSNRIVCIAKISASDLASFVFKQPSLVISDCEGFEKHLFTKNSVRNLKNSDVIIEVHEFIDSSIPQHLKDVFAISHSLEVFETVPDMRRAEALPVPQLEGYDLETKAHVLSEYRPCSMQWFVFTPVNSRATCE